MASFIWKRSCRNLLRELYTQKRLLCRNSRQYILPVICVQGKNFCTNLHLESNEPDMKDKATQIYRVIKSKDPDVCPESDFIDLYLYLLDFGIKATTVEDQFIETTDLLKHRLDRWTSVMEIFKEHSIPIDLVFRNVVLFPYLLECSLPVLQQNLALYSEMYIGKQSLLSTVQRYPELYFYRPKAVAKRMNMLHSIFPPAELKMVIKNNPNILTENWNSISEKIMYIHKEMGLEQPHIAACECLRKSLIHIKTRHQFLLRAGLYKKPNILRDKGSVRNNHSLSLIMDTSNRSFANKIAKLSEYEYDVFYCMIKEEDELQDAENEDESDAESDFDHNE
ncbi:hypothetical protein SK128_024785 [Halocaridina rubra]|uniref:Uncharacterized protein n=1 Tax=Halocaridina rubra TaxID=373956 RepID=A0AAN8W989_HALRR